MEYKNRTKKQLIEELVNLRGRIAELEKSEDKRKSIEEKVRKSEKKFRSIFNAAANLIILANKGGIVIDCNRRIQKVLGYTKEEIIGQSMLKLIHPDYLEEAQGCLKEISRKGYSYGKEYKMVRKDGTLIDVSVNSAQLRDEMSKDIFAICIIEDITERKRAEEELKRSHELLRNLTAHLQFIREEEKKLIASEVQDELGQVLIALKMDLSLLWKKLSKDQKLLLEKTKSMSSLLDGTIQIVKRLHTELRPSILNELGLTATIEWQAEEFQNRTGVKCKAVIDPEDIILDKDRSMAIFRIFQETLTNVARHASATRVKVSLVKKAEKVELKVRDNGRGITKEQINDPKSFGLTGIRERALSIGGEVKIIGVQGKGTTVTVIFPIRTTDPKQK